jgi:adenylate cyclase
MHGRSKIGLMKRCPQCNRVESDDALTFCRTDGTPLVRESVSGNTEAGTARFGSAPVSGEIVTSILPHTTDASINQATAPATMLSPTHTPGTTHELGKPNRRKVVVVVAIVCALGLGVVVTGVIVSAFLYRARTPTSVINSIAVMPFVNTSGNADVEYLSDGMTETLISSLSQLPNLNVKARSTVFRYKGRTPDARTIGKELSVQAVLNGRIMQRGDQLTLSLELVNAETENVIWSETYNRKQSELVSLQSEIARDVSSKLKAKLSGAETAKVEKTYTANAEAYQLYLRGRFYAIKRTAKDARQAIEYFQQAVAIDPNYALAYAGLAEANWFLALYSYPQVNDLVSKARELALKALELDSSLAEPHSILGVICNTYDRDFACMEREQKRAIELNPNYSEGHRRYGLVVEHLGRFEEARGAFKRALEIDPLSPVANYEVAHLLFYERRYEESETQSKKNIELDPNFWYAHFQLFYVYRMKRDYPSAVEELAKVQEARGEPDAAKFIRESFAKGDWQQFLRKITEQRTRLKLYPYFVATLFAELGEKDKAFATLNEALETKDQHTAWMKVDPYMDPLRADPRFQEVRRKAGFPE